MSCLSGSTAPMGVEELRTRVENLEQQLLGVYELKTRIERLERVLLEVGYEADVIFWNETLAYADKRLKRSQRA